MKTTALLSAPLALALVLGMGLTSQPAMAQASGDIEIGGDAGLTISIFPDDIPNETSVSLPVQRVRVGFWLSDQMSVEPGIGFNWFDEDDFSFTTLRFDGSILYHFGRVGAARPYLRGTGAFDWIRFSDDVDSESFTQFGAGGGVGAKLPITGNLSFRLDGGVTRFFENDDFFASTAINALVGLSVFVN